MEPIRDFFPFYFSFKDALQELEDSDRLAIYEGITNFAFFKQEPTLKTPIARACWKLIQPLLEKSQRNFENGIKGGAPKGSRNNPNGRRGNTGRTNRKLTEELTETNRELSNKDIDIDKDIDKDIDSMIVSPSTKPKYKSMERPSVKEVAEYMRSKGVLEADTLAEDFVDYFESNGWRVGKNPMQRWRSAANRWIRNNNKYGKDRKYNSSSTAENREEAKAFAISSMAR